MTRFRYRFSALAMAALLSATASGCVVGVLDIDENDGSGDKEATQLVTQSVSVSTQLGLRVTGLNGGVTVTGVPGAQDVTILATKKVRSRSISDAAAHLSKIVIVVESTSHEIQVETVHLGDAHGRSYSVEYEILIPASFCVTGVLANGNFLVEDLEANVELEAGNGNLILRDVVGSAWFVLGNGNLDASIYLPEGGEIVGTVGNGSAILAIQDDVSADFRAQVGNGTIVVSGLTLENPQSGPNIFRGLLGDGSGLIDLTVGNGNIRVSGR